MIAGSFAIFGCSSPDPRPSEAAGSSGTSGVGGAGGAATFIDGKCGTCVKTACGDSIASCSGDPECAAYLQCLFSCPTVEPDGNVDPQCAEACPKGSSSSAQSAEAAITACRTTGPGATSCPDCKVPLPGCVGENSGKWDWVLCQSCPASIETNKCFKCEEEHCCETYQHCADDPECQAYKNCLKACDPKMPLPCKDKCDQSNPKGIANYAPRIACLSVFCADQDSCSDVPEDPCVKCVGDQCGKPYVNVHADPEGYLLAQCTTLCDSSDMACFQACFTKYPDAFPLLETYVNCVATSCNAECN